MRLWYFLLYSSFLMFYNALSTSNKEQTGYVSVSNSNRIQVNLECQSRLMAIHIRFNSSITPWFTDWIVVGDSNRPECRIKGDGSLEYLIEIPLHGDQCGTVKIAPNTFETFIGVKKTPNLILDGDDLLKTRCVYGAPQIQQPVIPSLPATQRQAVLPFLTEPTPFEVTARTNISASFSQIYLITGISLLLIGLCVLYACLYYCFRRRQRKNKQNKTQRLLVSGPEIISRPDSSMAAESSRKSVMTPSWWAPSAPKDVDNSVPAALISHDYMLSISNNGSIKGPLSTSSADDTFMPSLKEPPERLTVISGGGQQRFYATASQATTSKTFPITTTPPPLPTSVTNAINNDNNKQNSIVKRLSVLYSVIDRKKKRKRNAAQSEEYSSSAISETNDYARSVSEIYASPAEVTSLHPDRVPEFSRTKYQESELAKQILLEDLANAVRRLCMASRHCMTVFSQVDIDRWENLVRQNRKFQELLLKSDFESSYEHMSNLPDYKDKFNSNQWALIVQALNEIFDRRRLAQAEDSNDQLLNLHHDSVRSSARLFTRDSFRRVQREMETLSDNNHHLEEKGGEGVINSNGSLHDPKPAPSPLPSGGVRSNRELFSNIPNLGTYHGYIFQRASQFPQNNQ